MFGKNKNKQEAPNNAIMAPNTYLNWEQDFGFLTLVLARHVNMNRQFYIDAYSKQLDKFDTLKDKDLKAAHEEIVYNIYTTFSDNYINFLVTKYFASKEKLIEFISDNVYVELLNGADAANKEKIKSLNVKKRLKTIEEINNKGKKVEK